MKKLMRKTYIVLFSLLTTFLLTISFIFNYQFYIKERNEVEYNLVRISKAQNSFNFFLNKPIIIDNIAYVVNFDENFNIKSIINYTDKKINEKEIVYLAKKFIKSNKEMMVGNLYLSGYSYFLDNRNSLIILDNSIVNKRLKSLLNVSVISLILLEIVVLYVSYALTKWLVKPVNEAFQKQKEFIYDASHELKTPLAVILSNAEMLESEPNEDKWINNIKSESVRMNKLVTDLLDLSRSENNINSEKYSVENISKSIEKMCLTFESLTFEKGLKLKSNIDKDIMLKCDIEKIKQLFTILMDNAIKYSDKKVLLQLT